MIPVSLYICLLHIISIENRPCLKKDVPFKLIYHRKLSKNKLTSTASEISSTILTKRFIHKIKINRRRVTSVIFHWLRRKIKYFFLHYTGVDTRPSPYPQRIFDDIDPVSRRSVNFN